MAGWIPVPASQWLHDRLDVEGRWPVTLVVLDLRYWADPIACGNRKRPGVRALAAAWSWSKSAAADFIKDRDAWNDPGQSADSRRTLAGQSAKVEAEQSSDERTLAGQSADTRRTAHKDRRARSPSPSPSPSLSQRERDSMCADFDELAAHWADHASRSRGDKRTRAPKYSSKGEPTKGLKRLMREVEDRDDIKTLMRWHWHGPDDARNREKGRGLMTLARHCDRYVVMAVDWDSGKQPAPRASTPTSGAYRHDFGALLDDDNNQQPEPLLLLTGGKND